jgi:putative SOS response-associated peptidase YedK
MERYASAPRYNIARGQSAAVTVDGATRPLRWGLLAPWRGHGGKRGPMIYEAPADAIAKTPHLRKAKRVLVPADGFYAWRGKQPYLVHAGGRVSLAGLAETRDDHVESFAFVTVPSTIQLTDMVPLVVDDAWGPVAVTWQTDALSDWVDDLAHDDARCITPLAQRELF